jgi:hypothetical protein
VGKVLGETYLADVSVRCVEDILGASLKLSQALDQSPALVGDEQPHSFQPAPSKCRQKPVELAWSSFDPSATVSTSRNPSLFTPIGIQGDVWAAVPTGKVNEVAAMLEAIHAQEDRAGGTTERRTRGGKVETD